MKRMIIETAVIKATFLKVRINAATTINIDLFVNCIFISGNEPPRRRDGGVWELINNHVC